MTEIPDSHPRAHSLRLRERLVAGVHTGLTSEAGLIAHGRGEVFDYLLGERTRAFAQNALSVASAILRTARHPMISVNGNVAALATDELAQIAAENPEIGFEVNLFHFSQERVHRIVEHLRGAGIHRTLGSGLSDHERLPGLESDRAMMDLSGIAQADVVLVPLEDGDRAEALVASNRQVLAIDLNPLSRTARTATVTIVDELTRALPRLCEFMREDRGVSVDVLQTRIKAYDNPRMLAEAVEAVRTGT